MSGDRHKHWIECPAGVVAARRERGGSVVGVERAVRSVLTVQSALAGWKTPGSTGPDAVAVQLAVVVQQLNEWHAWSVSQ